MLVAEVKQEIIEQKLDDTNWIAELKRDGNRVQIKIKNEKVVIYNRKGEQFKKDLPDEIINILKDDLIKDDYVEDCIIDGELTFTDDKGLDHRTQAQCENASPMIWLWDVLELNGENLRNQTWTVRKQELKTICDVYGWTYQLDSCIRYLPHFMDKRGLLKIAEETGMEGIVLKDVNASYIDGKSKSQIKIKFKETDDYIVVGYTLASEFSVNRKGETIKNKRFPSFKALLLAQYDKDGMLKSKAMVGGGFKDEDINEIVPLLHKDEKIIKSHSLIDKDYNQSKGKCYWLNQHRWFVIEINMSKKTEYGNPFQPTFLCLRPDKKIEECVENGK